MIPARVLVSYGSHGIVSTPDGHLDCRWRRGRGRPLCGDKVLISLDGSEHAALEEIEPRDSEFMRGDARGRAQLIAANLEQVVIVVAPEPEPSAFMVDRYLVATALMNLQPLLVLNKVDLLSPDQALLKRMRQYQSLGINIVQTSTKAEPGTVELKQALAGKISILVGQSGAGKSSLINALIPDRDEQTGALSNATGKGRHTTTRTLWIQIPSGGAVIDSPGVWEFGLWKMKASDIQTCLPDLNHYAEQCRFRNCLHQQEPECGVKAAIANGQLPQRRLDAFHNILSMQS